MTQNDAATTYAMTHAMTTYRLLELLGLAPHVRYEQRVTLAADAVLQAVRQLRLPKRHVITLAVSERDDRLLEERQRLVDVHRFRLRRVFRLKRHSFMTGGFPQKTTLLTLYSM